MVAELTDHPRTSGDLLGDQAPWPSGTPPGEALALNGYWNAAVASSKSASVLPKRASSRSEGRSVMAINAQPLEKVKVRVGDDSDPSTFSFRRDRRKNSGPS